MHWKKLHLAFVAGGLAVGVEDAGVAARLHLGAGLGRRNALKRVALATQSVAVRVILARVTELLRLDRRDALEEVALAALVAGGLAVGVEDASVAARLHLGADLDRWDALEEVALAALVAGGLAVGVEDASVAARLRLGNGLLDRGVGGDRDNGCHEQRLGHDHCSL
jgi:hypothetical protein